jgi:DNA polymerase-4
MLLFGQDEREKKGAVTKAIDAVNDRFGEHAITFASTITQDKNQRVISPAWRPSGVRKSDA